MVDAANRERITAYLQQERAAGYDIATIRNYLLSQGYNQELIDASIDQLFGKKKKTFEIPASFSFLQNKVVLIALLGILLVGIGAVMYLFIEEEPSKIFLPKSQGTPASLTLEEEPLPTREATNVSNDSITEKTPSREKGEEEKTNSEVTEQFESAKITQYTLETKIAQFDTLEDATEFCEQEDVVQDDCRAEVASRFEQPQLCTTITNSDKKENCILELAWSERGYEFCGEISDARKQNLCRNIAGVRSRDLTNNLGFEGAAYREATPGEEASGNASIIYTQGDDGSIIIARN